MIYNNNQYNLVDSLKHPRNSKCIRNNINQLWVLYVSLIENQLGICLLVSLDMTNPKKINLINLH